MAGFTSSFPNLNRRTSAAVGRICHRRVSTVLRRDVQKVGQRDERAARPGCGGRTSAPAGQCPFAHLRVPGREVSHHRGRRRDDGTREHTDRDERCRRVTAAFPSPTARSTRGFRSVLGQDRGQRPSWSVRHRLRPRTAAIIHSRSRFPDTVSSARPGRERLTAAPTEGQSPAVAVSRATPRRELCCHAHGEPVDVELCQAAAFRDGLHGLARSRRGSTDARSLRRNLRADARECRIRSTGASAAPRPPGRRRGRALPAELAARDVGEGDRLEDRAAGSRAPRPRPRAAVRRSPRSRSTPGGTPRTFASGPSTARITSASVISSAGRASQ